MKNEAHEITEEDLRKPLSAFVNSDRRKVEILDMGDYFDVFYAIERTAINHWQEHEALVDGDVIRAYQKLLEGFDRAKEGTLAEEISKSVKAMLLYRRRKGEHDYTYGEILSCLRLLIGIARQHESPDGIGYLRWTKNFFEGRMPTTEEEIREYIERYES